MGPLQQAAVNRLVRVRHEELVAAVAKMSEGLSEILAILSDKGSNTVADSDVTRETRSEPKPEQEAPVYEVDLCAQTWDSTDGRLCPWIEDGDTPDTFVCGSATGCPGFVAWEKSLVEREAPAAGG
jgi:hypothetical protein